MQTNNLLKEIRNLLGVGDSVFLTEEDLNSAGLQTDNDFNLYKNTSKIEKKELSEFPESPWKYKYLINTCREILANKFELLGDNLPGNAKLSNFTDLRRVAAIEKNQLINMLTNPNWKVEDAASIKDKLILTFYIKVGNLPDRDVKNYIKKVIEDINLKVYYDVISYYLPIRDGESRVEYISTFQLQSTDIVTIQRKFNEINDNFKEVLENIKKEEDGRKKN